jgi:hypothetical protein
MPPVLTDARDQSWSRTRNRSVSGVSPERPPWLRSTDFARTPDDSAPTAFGEIGERLYEAWAQG